jgi:hypothetical protein
VTARAKALDPSNYNRLTLLLLRLLEDLLDDLLLLDQESADNAVLDAVGASRSTVRTLDGLLGTGDGGIFAGTESGDTGKLGTAVLDIVKSVSRDWPGFNIHRT